MRNRKELKRHGVPVGFRLVGTLLPIVMHYVVIEITERGISSITPCASLEEGVQIANGLLKKLIEDDYELDMHTLYEDGAEGTDFQIASFDEPESWCNLKSRDWDAYVVAVPENTSDNSETNEYNGQTFNTRISVEDLAQRALDLKVGQTLYFKGNNCGDDVSEDGTQINGVTCIKSNDLGMFALIFSVVGGGNSFMVDVTEYDKVRSIRAIADDIYHHYGNDIFI